MYKEGTIKVAWINPNNFNELSSTMYSDLPSALQATKSKKDFMKEEEPKQQLKKI